MKEYLIPTGETWMVLKGKSIKDVAAKFQKLLDNTPPNRHGQRIIEVKCKVILNEGMLDMFLEMERQEESQGVVS